MLLTITTTAKTLKELIETKYPTTYEAIINNINNWRIRTRNTDWDYWIKISVPTWWVSVFCENILIATTIEFWEEITAWSSSIFSIYELDKFSLIVASWTQNINIMFF